MSQVAVRADDGDAVFIREFPLSRRDQLPEENPPEAGQRHEDSVSAPDKGFNDPTRSCDHTHSRAAGVAGSWSRVGAPTSSEHPARPSERNLATLPFTTSSASPENKSLTILDGPPGQMSAGLGVNVGAMMLVISQFPLGQKEGLFSSG